MTSAKHLRAGFVRGGVGRVHADGRRGELAKSNGFFDPSNDIVSGATSVIAEIMVEAELIKRVPPVSLHPRESSWEPSRLPRSAASLPTSCLPYVRGST